MHKRPYTKQPLTVQGHIELLKSRGLHISNEERATRYLQNIGYYHLSGYMHPFLADKKQHQYKPNSGFDEIINLYRFGEVKKRFVRGTPPQGLILAHYCKDNSAAKERCYRDCR